MSVSIDLAIEKLLYAQEQLSVECADEAYIEWENAKEAVQEALSALGYKAPQPKSIAENGRYILHDRGYEVAVDAVFDVHGELLTLVDDTGNQWGKWAVSNGIFDETRPHIYLKPIDDK